MKEPHRSNIDTSARLTENMICDFFSLGYFKFDQDGLILEVNEVAADLIGIDRCQLIQHNFSRYIAPEYQTVFMNHLDAVLNGRSDDECEIKIIRKYGPIFSACMASRVVEDSVSRQKYIISSIVDISGTKNHKEIHYSNDSVDKFASVISYEINHTLSSISNYLNGCIIKIENRNYQVNEIVCTLKKSMDQLKRAHEIILKMNKGFSKDDMVYEKNDIHILVKETIALLANEMGSQSIRIDLKGNKNIPKISLDRIHVQHVMINLIRNAIEALKDANTVDPKIIIEINCFSKDTIEVLIIDNGPGLKRLDLNQLFNPNCTTKPYGAGLGLTFSRSIIEAHGGQLTAENHILGGACFKFTLKDCSIK